MALPNERVYGDSNIAVVQAGSQTAPTVVLRLIPGQSSNLLELRDPNDNLLYYIDKNGGPSSSIGGSTLDSFLVSSPVGVASWTRDPILANTHNLQQRDSAATAIPIVGVDSSDMLRVGFQSAPATNGHLLLYAGGVEAARINPDGRVSIGTTSILSDTKVVIQGTRSDALGAVLWGLDSSGRSTARLSTHGRLDLPAYDTDGGICVLDYLPTVPLVNTRAGHYAFGNKDDAGNRQTIGIVECWIRDITAASVDSEVSIDYMANQNCTAGANQQPATKVVFSAAGSVLPTLPLVLGSSPAAAGSIRLPAGSSIQSAGDLTLTAPSGHTFNGIMTNPATASFLFNPVVTLSASNRGITSSFPIISPSGAVGQIYGFNLQPIFFGTEGVTTNPITTYDNFYSLPSTNAAYDSNITNLRNYYAGGLTHAGGGTIANLYGYYSAVNAGAGLITNAWAFYGAGTAPSFLGGPLTVTDAAALVRAGAALNNGAGAGAGTITNAPTAGNPTKWVPIIDNGTTRYIPTWT